MYGFRFLQDVSVFGFGVSGFSGFRVLGFFGVLALRFSAFGVVGF